MRKKILSATAVLILVLTVAASAEDRQGPVLTLETENYDCGTVYYEEVDIKKIEFEFSNTGNAPLILKRIYACCGTVVSYWPREPVLPDEKSKIVIQFRVMRKPHAIRRVVSVESNSIDGPLTRLHITGQVEQKPEKPE